MVTLPSDFVATKYPGYFWNIKNKRLYSIKISGMLKPLSGPQKPNHWNHGRIGWQVSHRRCRRWLDMEYLKKLQPCDSIIPVDEGGITW